MRLVRVARAWNAGRGRSRPPSARVRLGGHGVAAAMLCALAALGVLILLTARQARASPTGSPAYLEDTLGQAGSLPTERDKTKTWPTGNLVHVEDLPRLLDPVEGTFESPSWDVQAVYFTLSRQFLYVGVDTVGLFDRNGGEGSTSGQTVVLMEFREVPAGATQTIRLVLTDTTAEVTIDGQAVPPCDAFGWPQWRVYTGTDLEVTIGSELLPYFVRTAIAWADSAPMGVAGVLDFRLVLDHGGPGPRDEVAGRVPEPGSLLVLALGCPVVLKRRRRQARSPGWRRGGTRSPSPPGA